MKERCQKAEAMDDLQGDPQRLARTLRDFRWLNRFVTRYRWILQHFVLEELEPEPEQVPLLWDVGCGAGDIPAWLARKAAERGLPLRIVGIDLDPRAIALAQQQYGELPGLEFRCANALELIQSEPAPEYLYAQHMLHHLSDEEIPCFLNELCAQVKRRWLIHDLLRSRSSYALFTLALFWIHPRCYIWEDGRTSIRKGFRKEELLALLPKEKIRYQHLLPGHFLLWGDGNEGVEKGCSLKG